jgi:hypothetical protein
MGIIEGLDPVSLADAGWGILFPAEANPRIVEALAPLLEWRRGQAAAEREARYREFRGPELGVRPGEGKTDWLVRQGAGPGPANPEKVPYYLLIAASPSQVSYRFQNQLNVQYAVGRVWFDHLSEWAAYAEAVVRAEQEDRARPSHLAIFAPIHSGDPYTQAVGLRVQELAYQAQSGGRLPGWQVQALTGHQATHAALVDLLQGSPPALTLLSGHALVFPPGHERQRKEQGGLVCADWPGPRAGEPPGPGQCFVGGDVPARSDLCGCILVQHTSYSLGTPELEDQVSQDGQRLARQPFTAHLPQRLLGLPDGRGALAVVGWNNRLWSSTDPQQAAQENSILESCLADLAVGRPAGYALEGFSARFAEVSTSLSDYLYRADYGAEIETLKLGGYWVSNNNARDLGLFGDPAARLRIAEAGAEMAAQQAISLNSYFNSLSKAHSQVEVRANPVELELRLSAGSGRGAYRTELRLEDPGGGVDSLSGVEVRLDLYGLERLANEPAAYGHQLWNELFADEATRALLLKAIHSADEQDLPLRLRLTLDSGAAELLDLAWERVLNPSSGSLLARQEHPVWFTRTLSEAAWSAVEPRQREHPRALVAVATPAGLERYASGGQPVALVDRQGEIEQAREALRGYEVNVLSDTAAQVSHGELTAALREGYDLLYLVCHAARSAQGALGLFFERPDGQVAIVHGEQFARLLGNMSAGLRPGLVVLVPPLQANPTGPAAAALARLAPLLVQVGVPAVLALQASLPPDPRGAFLRAFFDHLFEYGQPDQAAHEARLALASEGLAWVPVLYTRPAANRLWTIRQAGEIELAGETAEPSLAPPPPPPGGTVVAAPPAEAAPSSQPEPFEIALTRQGVGEYAVEMRFLEASARGLARIDFAGLQPLVVDANAYGALLTQNLLAEPILRSFFQRTLALAQSRAQPLQLRLAADPGAPELHTLYWEGLVDPSSGSFLALSEDLAFTRYLFSAAWRKVDSAAGSPAWREKGRESRRVVLAAASPRDVANYGLIPLEIPTDLLRILDRAGGWDVTVIGQEPGEPVTLERLAHELKGGAGLLWLICHGSAARGEPVLYLTDEQGGARPVRGGELVKHLSGYGRLPNLLHITGSWSVPTGLALAEAGAPAVMVMNGNISKRTYRAFSAAFLRELLVDANPARSAAVARSTVQDRPDWWVPVLFTRLRDPRLW